MDNSKKYRVFKVKYADCIRRLTFEYDGRIWYPSTSFEDLKDQICEYFSLPSTGKILITYQDADGDLVTFSSQREMIDILDRQSMNPVLVQVMLVEQSRHLAPSPQPYATNSLGTEVLPAATVVDKHLSLAQILHKLSSNLEPVKTQIQLYQKFPDSDITGMVEELLEMMTIAISVLSFAVKVGQLGQL